MTASFSFIPSLLIATMMLYANILNPDESPSKSASHPDPICFTLGKQFYYKLSELMSCTNEEGERFSMCKFS